jgi:hypothetical protein
LSGKRWENVAASENGISSTDETNKEQSEEKGEAAQAGGEPKDAVGARAGIGGNCNRDNQKGA